MNKIKRLFITKTSSINDSITKLPSGLCLHCMVCCANLCSRHREQ